MVNKKPVKDSQVTLHQLTLPVHANTLGNVHGGTGPQKHPGVTVTSWGFMGNYAIRFDFSDGHDTGLYSYDYLIKLREKLNDWSATET